MNIGNLKKIYFGVLFLFLIIQRNLVAALFQGGWDYTTLYFLIPILALLLGTFLFWKEFQIGLLLLVVFSVYSGVSLFSAGFITLVTSIDVNEHATYMILPTFSSILQLLVGLVYLLLAWGLANKKNTDEIGTNRRLISASVSITTIIALNCTFG